MRNPLRLFAARGDTTWSVWLDNERTDECLSFDVRDVLEVDDASRQDHQR